MILTIRGIPEIYYGDELEMTGGRDPDNRHDFPGGWTEDARNAFTKTGRTRAQEEIFGYAQSLLRLREQHPALRRGKLWSLASDDSTYIFLRETEEERILVAFHAGDSARDFTLHLEDTPAHTTANAVLLFGSGQADSAGKTLTLHLPAKSLTMFLLQ